MKINGVHKTGIGSGTVVEVLSQLNLVAERVVVEVNGDIVPRGQYATHWIDEAAEVEIVSFVGGG